MSEELESDGEDRELKPLAIEGQLPLKAVGIENLREANPQYLPPHRYIHPWFARRPTPASRLAVLASVLPADTDSDELLELMRIGPREGIDGSISEYVERKKATEDERSGNLESHYGYPRPFTLSPDSTQRDDLYETLRESWGGDLPTVLDPTAGGGVIPFESLRYGLPTGANELNPVPSLILKLMLEYAPGVGDIESEVIKWARKVDERAAPRVQEYFPADGERSVPDNYVSTYKIECRSCGAEIPLVPKWTIRTRSDGITVVVRPHLSEEGKVSYEVLVDPTDEDLESFDPSDGPVSRGGDTECLNCGVVTEDNEVRDRLADGQFEYDIYCVRFLNDDGTHGFRSPVEADHEALRDAQERIDSDFELSTFLDTQIPQGSKTSEPRNFGMEEWRDLFSPRQLVSNYEYVNAIDYYRPEIQSSYDDETAEAILTILTLAFSKLIDRNIKLADWDTTKGYPNPMFKGKNFAFKRTFVDNNISVGGQDFISNIEKIYDSYRELVGFLAEDAQTADLNVGDAADLPHSDDDIEAVVIDPPYYSSIQYAELSDVFYVWMREALGEVFPDLFADELTEKEEEAVANPDRFDGVAADSTSKRDLANRDYEEKMADIFSELYRVLEPGGVMTVMFTHKETDAWDTLTKSLIESGFIITATHPITSEMPQRAGMRQSASADTTLLLTGRKPHEEPEENPIPSLWSDVRAETREAATEAARDLLESGLSLTKTDVIISAFGPTLRVYADAYPVVNDQDEEVPPRRALEEAREAVTRVLVEEFLAEDGMEELDEVTEWYVLCWLVHESAQFDFDDGLQLGYGIGIDIEEIKRDTKVWRKRRGDIALRSHDERVQDIETKRENRSSRLPVDPDALSYSRGLDAVHAAMHVYDVRGEAACVEWLRQRNLDTDTRFESTLRALLQVLPRDHDDWGLARDLAVGRTREVLDLNFGPEVFGDRDEESQSDLNDFRDDDS